jgi:hypothetical protein
VDPVSHPPLLIKFGSAGNRTWGPWVSNQELWPLDPIYFVLILICHCFYLIFAMILMQTDRILLHVATNKWDYCSITWLHYAGLLSEDTHKQHLCSSGNSQPEREQNKRRMSANRHALGCGRKQKRTEGTLSAVPLFCSKSLVPSLRTARDTMIKRSEEHNSISLLELFLSLQGHFSLLSQRFFWAYAMLPAPQL